MEIEWPNPIKLITSISNYEHGRMDGEERMLAKCKAAVERASGKGLVEIDMRSIAKIVDAAMEDILSPDRLDVRVAKKICERFGRQPTEDKNNG